jgi:group II intron reverse transcriptase/maturase
MPETANIPVGKVRQLQGKPWARAKRSKTRRFHALYGRIYRGDVLWEAWKRVRRNPGAAGVDETTLQAIEERGVQVFLEAIQADLRAGRYRPQPVKRRDIPKADGKQRPLGIPTVRDRVVQGPESAGTPAKLVVEPIFEADFLECSYGFRPKRSATQALEAIRVAGNRGYNFVVDADIRSYFDSIDPAKWMVLVGERIWDRRVLKLIRQWLEAGVMEDGTVRETLAGTPQGGVVSPRLANIYLHSLGRIWAARCEPLGILVRYGDDFAVLSKTESRAREALRRIGPVMERLGLELHPDKTRMVDLRRGREDFVFLGCAIRKRRSIQRNRRRHFVQRWPSPQAMQKIRERVRELTDARRRRERDAKAGMARLNPVLRGWGNHFRSGNADRKFTPWDAYVHGRLVRWMSRRSGQRVPHRGETWSRPWFYGLGLYRLRGTVRYPAQAAPRRSSLSRVQ